MINVCIVIPAYNEEKRIDNTLKKYGEYFQDLKKKKFLDFEILIVINNTQDKTEEIVKKFQKEFNEIRYLNFKQGRSEEHTSELQSHSFISYAVFCLKKKKKKKKKERKRERSEEHRVKNKYYDNTTCKVERKMT